MPLMPLMPLPAPVPLLTTDPEPDEPPQPAPMAVAATEHAATNASFEDLIIRLPPSAESIGNISNIVREATAKALKTAFARAQVPSRSFVATLHSVRHRVVELHKPRPPAAGGE